MPNYVLFGAPGSGKGTQCEKLVKKYALLHLSTGDMLRKEIQENTDIGREVLPIMEKGHIVPDAIVIEMIEKKVSTNKNISGFLFDGFPRTKFQAEALDKVLEKYNTVINKVIVLEVSKAELLRRLSLRSKALGRTDDGNTDIIRTRLQEYRKKTTLVLDYYGTQNKVFTVGAEGDIDEIFRRIDIILTGEK